VQLEMNNVGNNKKKLSDEMLYIALSTKKERRLSEKLAAGSTAHSLVDAN